jgi:FkbM family methyltransferase
MPNIMSILLSFLPGNVGKKYERKVLREKTKSSDDRFLHAIHNSSGRIAIDLGANCGKYTKIMAEHFDKIIAFEPNPDAFSKLNIELSDCNNVTIYQQAVGNTFETKHKTHVQMFLRNEYDKDPISFSEGTTIFSEKNNVGSRTIDVEYINIIDFIGKITEKIGILKIDIEGAEVSILEELIDCNFIKNIDYIFCETHEFKIDSLYKRTKSLRKLVKKIKKPIIDLDWG